jgi:chromate transporter
MPEPTPEAPAEPPAPTSPWTLAGLFLRLGVTAFGGPAVHIALMKDEVVTRRRWLSAAEFLDLLGATQLIPGPNSTELAIHIGFLRGRWRGLVLAGLCFIVPAALIVAAFAWAYLRFGALPQVAGLLYAVKPVVVAIVVQAIAGLLAPAVKGPALGALGLAVLTLALLGVDELALLFGAGALAGASRWATTEQTGGALARVRPLLTMLLVAAASVGLPTLLTRTLPAAASASEVPFGLGPLFLFFLKVGSVLYGSGYVLIAFLRDGLVTDWQWLTEAQLIDAVAVGQVTPGPVFTTATFIGYLLGGPAGAVVATLGIFLPSFIFVALSAWLVPRLRRSPLAGAFLDGVNVAALALMLAVTWELGRVAIIDPPTLALALLSALLLLRFKVNAAWLIAGAAALGAVLRPLS